jgi:hypothetical protein
VRIAPNSLNAGSATVAVSSVKLSSFSFIEALTSASSDAVQGPNASDAQSQSRSNARGGRASAKNETDPVAVATATLQSAAELTPVPVEPTVASSQMGDAKSGMIVDVPASTTSSVELAKTSSAERLISGDTAAASERMQSVAPQILDSSESAPVQTSQPVAKPVSNRSTAAPIQLEKTVAQPSSDAALPGKALPTVAQAPAAAEQDAFSAAAPAFAAAIESMMPESRQPVASSADSMLSRSIGDPSRTANPSTANKNANTQFSAKSDTTVASGNNNPKALEGSSSSSKGNQSDGQSAQHSQSDAAVVNAIAAKATDGSPAQAAGFQTHVAVHEAAASSPAPARVDEGHSLSGEGSMRGAIDVQNGEPLVAAGINAARLIQTMNASEMRVGMHSSEFGDISIRTSVSQQQMLTQITVAHGDLGTAISAHIPSMQEKFGNEFGLHASVEVNQGGASLTGERDQGSPREQKPFSCFSATTSMTAGAETDPALLRASSGAGEAYRLDIRA